VVVQEEVLHEVKVMAERLEKSHPGIHTQPLDILCCSAEHNVGVNELAELIRDVLKKMDGVDASDDVNNVVDWEMSLPDA
jgi:hypothetical protein